MEYLNEYKMLDFNGEMTDKETLLDLIRLQKQLLLKRNILATIEECMNIWQWYSHELCASWLFFPDNDESILIQIESSNNFTDYKSISL